jgi:NAD(P)-dependent dehydrogenase (short-subunit alcohol dehydrogenase family)
MSVEFHDQVVAVTGAAGGIGRELCRFFAAAGARVAALDRSDSVSAFARELRRNGATIEAGVADIGDADAVRTALAAASSALGAVDVLINNAGATKHPSLEGTSPEGFSDEVRINLTGAYNCCHALLPEMKARRRGVIVNVGSVNGLSALGDAAYSAGKAGLISLTKAIALEFGRYGIRANIVCPGTVRTPIWDERSARNPEVLAQLTRWYPLRRIAEPIEVVKAVAFLASADASAITGAVLPVDCGLSAGNIVMARELSLEDF